MTDDGSDELVNLQVELTGTAPWTILWTDGVYQENIQSSPAIRTVPRDGQTYSLAGVSDAECSGTVNDTEVVAEALPDAIDVPLLRNSSLALLTLLLTALAAPALRRRRLRVR